MPWSAGLVSFGLAAWLAALVPEGPLVDWIRIALVPAVGGPLYLVLFRGLAPGDWRELFLRLRQARGGAAAS